jgi:predicted MFS family arabinose efflux permease
VIGFALGAAWIARHHFPEEQTNTGQSVDYTGAVLVTLGLAGVVGALIVLPDPHVNRSVVLASGVGGLVLLVAFLLFERRTRHPLLPLAVFRSRQFTGANLTTLLAYAALGGLFFLLMPQLQSNLGYSALAAGASLLPINVLSLLISPISGRVAGRIGPRWPMTAGTLVMALGMVLFTRVGPGAMYLATVFPAAAVFGLGLATMVAPLTAAVLAAVPEGEAGVASAVNNAAARLAGLLGAAALPLAAGLGGMTSLEGSTYTAGFTRAMWICAGLCLAGGVVALLTVREGSMAASATRRSRDRREA